MSSIPLRFPDSPSRPTAIDLFCGAGGFSLGLEQAGFDVLAATDHDPVHAATHEFNFPHTAVLCADASKLDPGDLLEAAKEGAHRHGHEDWYGRVDLIAGGPPCQGFSLIGKRLVDDNRNQLIFHFLRLVLGVRPRFFVMENVPGMVTGAHTTLLDQLIREFESAGYQVVTPVQVLNAAEYGVPQSRNRLFLYGALEGERLPRYPGPTSRPMRDSEQSLMKFGSLPTTPTVGEAIGDLPNLDDFEGLRNSDEVVLSPTTLRRMKRESSDYVRMLRGEIEDASDKSYPRAWEPSMLTSSLQTQHMETSIDRFRQTRPGEVESISRFLRLDPEGLCNTLRAGTGRSRGAYTSPRPIHPEYPRVISVREAARLHSIPDWFRFHTTKWHGFRQVGNSVPPLLGRAVASTIVEILGTSPARPERKVELGDPGLLSFSPTDAASYFDADPEEVPQARARGVSA